jgi:inner membrane protein
VDERRLELLGMASVGHLAVGMLLGRVYGGQTPARRWGAVAAGGGLALLPDADVVGLTLGLSDEGFWGHRGYSHTLVFAGLVALGVFALLRRRVPDAGFAALLSFAAVASHCVLDAMTYDSRGIAFFWPLDDQRLTLPLRIIPPAPTGLAYLSWRGVEVTTVELVYFFPIAALALAPRGPRALDRLDARLVGAAPPVRLGAACLLVVVSLAAADRYVRSTSLIAWLETSGGRAVATSAHSPP